MAPSWLTGCAGLDGCVRGTSQLTALRREVWEATRSCTSEERLRLALELLGHRETLRCSERSATGLGPKFRSKTFLEVVNALSDVVNLGAGKVGMDIGGTLVKCALLEVEPEARCNIPETFGETGQRHGELSFNSTIEGKQCCLNFVSGATDRLANMLEVAKSPTAKEGAEMQVVATGGGAHRFRDSMRKGFNLEMLPFQEMESLVFGLSFLMKHGPRDEVFTFDREGELQEPGWPELPFPCLLVNMGSGVSILRVDNPPDLHSGSHGGCVYSRLGGTACGGATFLGLARLLTSARDFQHVLDMAAAGNAKRVNKLVSDIYGEEGSKSLGLSGGLTAAYFGKLVSEKNAREVTDERDVAAALLMLVVQESVVLARALAQAVAAETTPLRLPTSASTASGASQRGAVPVYFVGGFLAKNTMAQKLICSTYHGLGNPPPLFLRHADFLGSLGALGKAL